MTTISTGDQTRAFKTNPFQRRLLIAGLLAIALSAYHPDMVADWLLENLLVGVLIVWLVATYKRMPFSDFSYLLILGFVCIHEMGAHHKYADVPIGEWLKPVLHTNRNHYDRIAHFSFGLLLAYPMQEMLIRSAGVRGNWRYYLPIDISLALGATYEIIEAIVANIVSPQAGDAFLGLQGDIWDSQKDMAMAGIGAVVSMTALYAFRYARAHRESSRARSAGA